MGYETLLLTAVLWLPVPQTVENTMREHFREHSATSCFGVTLLRQLSLQLLLLPRETQAGIRNTLLITAVLWPPVPQTLENTMREHFCKHSATSCFGVTPLRQLSLQLLFLPREKQGGIRNFSSNWGSVASSSPSRRNHNARALPRALRDLLVWGHPSSSTVAAIAILA